MKTSPSTHSRPSAQSRTTQIKTGRKAVGKKVPSIAITKPSTSMIVVASGEVFTAGAAANSVPQANRLRPARGKKTKGRVLWIGDALVPTGFATVTHNVLAHLHRNWDVIVSGVNYDGSAHSLPYSVIPAWQGGDMWGMDRFSHVCAEFAPDAVVINSDWWNVAKFAALAPKGVPIIGYMPVDGGNLDPKAMRSLNRLAAAVWYTDFGYREAKKAGFKGARQVVPHGIALEVFHPAKRSEARKRIGLDVPKGAFIVGNVNRNQPRKRLDVTIQIFAAWIKRHKVRDAYLLLHCAKKDTGWDLERVARHYGVANRLIITGNDEIRGMKEQHSLRMIYSSLDVQITSTLGEGWGLTTMEGMACGIPQIVPDAAALAEWAEPAVKVPCSRELIHPEINTIGALVDEEAVVAALHSIYQDKAKRKELSARGLEHVARDEFSWSSVARKMDGIIASAVRLKRATKGRARTASAVS